MIQDVREHLEAVPFEPFSIVMSGGKVYSIPTADHANVNPRGNRLVVWLDDGGSVIVSGLHITAIEENTSTAS
jgi:hypothetical protein